MIRSSACQPWQPDLPGHAGDRGDLLSYTTPWDTIWRISLFCARTSRVLKASGVTLPGAGWLYAGSVRLTATIAAAPRRKKALLLTGNSGLPTLRHATTVADRPSPR